MIWGVEYKYLLARFQAPFSLSPAIYKGKTECSGMEAGRKQPEGSQEHGL